MRRLPSYLARAFAVLLLLSSAAPTAPSTAAAPASGAVPVPAQDPHPAKCCFTNPGYAGTCEVVPAKDETCASILGYLNNPLSQGKGYCGNTTIRGGWQSVVCEPKQ
jgi:hypothetical protein